MDSVNHFSKKDPDRWQRLWEIFHEAKTKEPSECAAFLKESCGTDAEMLHEIEELLAVDEEAAKFFGSSSVFLTANLTPDAMHEQPSIEFLPEQILSKRFQIVEHVGRGAMGTVFKAVDLELKRQVALKFLHIEDPRWSRRFLLEARFQARIDHDHICKVYEVGEIDGKHYIAMQFISGKTLKEAAPEMTLRQKVRIVQQVCNAVQAAHGLGVIHRDLKPTNILVTRNEAGEWIPFITDFGLARELTGPGFTSTGMVMGTPCYMAPEQARGEIRNLDRRCDVYSLGATLYEALSGKPPFEGDSTVEVLSKVIHEDPVPIRHYNPQIPVELETIVQKCLQKEPERRYETAEALSEELGRYLEGEPILARPTSWGYRAMKRIKKYPVVSAILAVAIWAVISLVGFSAWTWWRTQAQSRLENEFEQEVSYMDDTARHAYTEPMHDVRKEEGLVEERLKAIEKRIQQEGSVAEGPGNFAMGRGYMVMFRFPEARTHLEKAWKEYKIPRVAYALGVTLTYLYQTELERAKRIPNKEEREKKIVEIQKEYRDPALRYINEGRSAVEAPEYVEGLIAYLENKYEEALGKTQTAFQRQPWLFEAKKLEADILRAMGNERKASADTDGAIALYKKADVAYREAVRKGASYSLGFGSLCALGHDWTNLMMYQTGFPDEVVLKRSVEACDQSLKINPDKPEAYIARSALMGSWGSYELGKGLDPTVSFTESIESARKALKWERVRFAAYTNMAVAYSRLSNYQMMTGKDAGYALDQSIECNRQAVLLNPNNAAFRNNLGISYAIKAGWEKEHSRETAALQDQAIKEFQEAIKIQPKYETAFNSLGVIYFEKAQAEFEKGRDPMPLTELSITNLKKCGELNPSFFPNFVNLVDTYNLQARYAIKNDSNPDVILDLAIQNFQKSIELNPQNAESYMKVADTYIIRAEWEMKQKQDPSTSLKSADANLKKAEELAPGIPGLAELKVKLTSRKAAR